MLLHGALFMAFVHARADGISPTFSDEARPPLLLTFKRYILNSKLIALESAKVINLIT